MRRLFIVLLIIACYAFSAEINISIVAFNATGVSEIEAKAIESLFTSKMVGLKIFKVLDRANMEKILKEQSFQNLGCTDQACAVKIGKLLNMDYMITGEVMSLGGNNYLTVNMVSVEKGEIVESFSSEPTTMANINNTLSKLANKFRTIRTGKTESRLPEPVKTLSRIKTEEDTTSKSKADVDSKYIAPAVLSWLCGGGFFIGGAVFKNRAADSRAVYANATGDFDSHYDSYKKQAAAANILSAASITAGTIGLITTIARIRYKNKMEKWLGLDIEMSKDTVFLSLHNSF